MTIAMTPQFLTAVTVAVIGALSRISCALPSCRRLIMMATQWQALHDEMASQKCFLCQGYLGCSTAMRRAIKCLWSKTTPVLAMASRRLQGQTLSVGRAQAQRKTPHSLNCLPLLTEKPFFSLKSASSHPFPQNWLKLISPMM